MKYTKHTVGEMGKDGLQVCIHCGEIVLDYRTVCMSVSNSGPIAPGFKAGAMYVSENGRKQNMLPQDGGAEIIECKKANQ